MLAALSLPTVFALSLDGLKPIALDMFDNIKRVGMPVWDASGWRAPSSARYLHRWGSRDIAKGRWAVISSTWFGAAPQRHLWPGFHPGAPAWWTSPRRDRQSAFRGRGCVRINQWRSSRTASGTLLDQPPVRRPLTAAAGTSAAQALRQIVPQRAGGAIPGLGGDPFSAPGSVISQAGRRRAEGSARAAITVSDSGRGGSVSPGARARAAKDHAAAKSPPRVAIGNDHQPSTSAEPSRKKASIHAPCSQAMRSRRG